MTVESTITRAKDEIANGRIWRAKEVLGSSISNYGYSQEIFKSLADVLLKMGDDLEAGKYLLLSVDVPSEKEMVAINAFLARCKNPNYKALLAKFPGAARLDNRGDYPDLLRNYLSNMGAPLNLGHRAMVTDANTGLTFERLAMIGCLLSVVVAITCMIVGACTIFKWIWSI